MRGVTVNTKASLPAPDPYEHHEDPIPGFATSRIAVKPSGEAPE